MIHSMTGYGAAHFEVGGVAFDLELRSVNHRHLDVRVRLPRPLAALELATRARVQKRLARGKVDLGVTPAGGAGALAELGIDLGAAGRYVEAAARLRETHGVPGELSVGTLLGLPGVSQFVERALPAEVLGAGLERATDQALDALVAMRAAEGRTLECDLRTRLEQVLSLVADLEARAGTVVAGVREKLRRRAEQLREETGLLDDARLHQEVVIAADRLDVTEELVRLCSHVAQFRAILDRPTGDGVGRRLEFLLQEMSREANTVGSKGSDSTIAHAVVELKTELERIREQVQNVE